MGLQQMIFGETTSTQLSKVNNEALKHIKVAHFSPKKKVKYTKSRTKGRVF